MCKKVTIVLVERCEDEMAFLFVNGEVVFLGNVWDFHPGCVGNVINGKELVEWDGTTPEELLEELASAYRNDPTVTELNYSHRFFESVDEADVFMGRVFDYSW